VFPILSLKALQLARANTAAADARREALAYTAGVVLVVMALGAAILALRAGGASIGWAFQLQNPRVILALLLLSAAIGFNLAGLFELPTPQVGGHGASGAFATGALAGAMAGGLILNVMPCVFPILSLKALGLARAGGEERTARIEALAYAAGVITVCVALGGAILALRAGGGSVGWAFQLQDARVVAALLLLAAAIGFNLAGLFELTGIGAGGALAARSGAAGAFWTGALAAFVATPCTGPFMAAALGAALLLPWPAALTVFAGLGLGLALPFLAIGFVPALRRRLPRPGPWMETFRRLLAVPMWLTALGLAWVLGRQAGGDAVVAAIGAAAALAIGLWLTGLRQRALKGMTWLPAALGLAAAAAILAATPRASTATATEAGAERYDPARLAALRRSGRPVFLYFTADWCLSCKVNEGVAIDRAETRAAFARGHVATMVGDWTRGDPAIGRFLSEHGRSGVPLYLWYAANGRTRELPQVLTPGLLSRLAAGTEG
jgi:thiol:disulfide interchange protein